jgi:hypothetical protein
MTMDPDSRPGGGFTHVRAGMVRAFLSGPRAALAPACGALAVGIDRPTT